MPTLRPNQLSAIEALRAKIRAGRRRVVMVAPTGYGKTVVLSSIIGSATERGRRSLVIVHRKELVDQTMSKLKDVGIRAGVLMGSDSRRDDRLAVQVGSIQTLARRLPSVPIADIVIYDECHHSASESAKRVLAAYPHAVQIGCTATPWRSDKRGLADLYEDLVVAATPRELIKAGHLVLYEPFAYDSPDLHNVSTVLGEFNKKELALACNTSVLVGSAVEEYGKHAAGKRALVFPCNCTHSRDLVTAFCAAGFRAKHLDWSTPRKEREAILSGFGTGAVQLVSSVGVLTEGFDQPAAEVCILARPTKSLSLYIQMVGRVLRTCPGKTRALIHDHSGNILRHGFPDDERDYSLTATPGRVIEMMRCTDCSIVVSRWKSDGTCPNCGSLQHMPTEDEKLCPGCGECCQRAAPQCPVCGHVFAERARQKSEVTGERLDRAAIVRIRARFAEQGRDITPHDAERVANATREQKAAEYLRLQGVAQRKGFQPGFVGHAYRDTFGVWPRFKDGELDGVAPATKPFIPLPPHQEHPCPSPKPSPSVSSSPV